MTKLEALRTLAVKAEAGEWPVDAWSHLRMVYPTQWNEIALNARKAFDGSLDAAKALHEDVLPGWDIQITTYEDDSFEASVSHPMKVKTYDGISAYMSRAWLLAIIRALISQE